MFTQNGGRDMRAMFATRMNEWFHQHGIETAVDHRSFADRGMERSPEPDIPKWQWERKRRTGEVGDSLNLILCQRAMGKRGQTIAQMLDIVERTATSAATEIQAIKRQAREQRQTIMAADDFAVERQAAWRRRLSAAAKNGSAAALRKAYQLDGWIPATTVMNMKRIRFDEELGVIFLLLEDGSRIRDDGISISLYSPVTTVAADEMISAIVRRGWVAVTLTGSPDFKDAIAERCALHKPPIRIEGYTMSAKAQGRVEAKLRHRDVSQRNEVLQKLVRLTGEAEVALRKQPSAQITQRLRDRQQEAQNARLALLSGDTEVVKAAASGDIEAALMAGRRWGELEADRHLGPAASCSGQQLAEPGYRPR